MPGKLWNLFGFLVEFVKYVSQVIGLYMFFYLTNPFKTKIVDKKCVL